MFFSSELWTILPIILIQFVSSEAFLRKDS